jgi:predicted phosphodiesterase
MIEQKVIRIVAISDSHDTHHLIDIEKLPQADIFIHAGDFTQNSYRG